MMTRPHTLLFGIESSVGRFMSSVTTPIPQHLTARDPIELLSLLRRLGVSSELATQAASCLGNKLYQTIEEDPYSLCELLSASFFEVEAYATQQGFSTETPQRLRAGVLFLLHQETGNYFSIRSSFLRKASRLLNVNPHQISHVMQTLENEGRVIPHGEHIWTKHLNDIEGEVAERILALCDK
jgi:Helix-hairpin-helix containing domain